MDLDELFARALDRRTFGHAVAALAGAAAMGSFAGPAAYAAERLRGYPFTLGVASGDPGPYGFVLWTRLAPNPLHGGGMPKKPVNVDWQVATDPQMRSVVRSGTVRATPQLAHSVHVQVKGLAPGRSYFYRFRAAGELSPVGRTCTVPEPGQQMSAFSFAFASCQRLTPNSRYTAYQQLAQEDVSLAVHLGDYIYEERSTRTLTDYRRLHARYKLSPDLRAAHAAMPFVVTFDDHEVADNYCGDRPKSGSAAKFLPRRAAAYKAYYEHMPVPVGVLPHGPDMRLYRRVTIGDLLTLHVLDTRQYRSGPPPGDPTGALALPTNQWTGPNRTMLGGAQEEWLAHSLTGSRTRWNVLAQQTMMMPYDFGGGRRNGDSWDGYPAARERLLGLLGDGRVKNPIVVSGDTHQNFVGNLVAAGRPIGAEFVGTSISSRPPRMAFAPQPDNQHVLHQDGSRRGYVRCDVGADRWVARLRTVADPAVSAGPAGTQAQFVVRDGAHRAEQF